MVTKKISKELRRSYFELSRIVQKAKIIESIYNLFSGGPVDDGMVHALADKLAMSPHDLETQIYALLQKYITGGVNIDSWGGIGAGLTSADVNPDELKMGIEVEREHTDNPKIAERIALDHLAEDEHYYSKLKTLGL